MIALLVITDGRPCVEQAVESAAANLEGVVSERLLVDDSGDAEHHAWLERRFPDFEVVWHPHGRQGFGGAIRFAWSVLLAGATAPYVFHLEDDFTFNRPVDVDAMVSILAARSYLVQLALRRQAWNDDEKAAGGIVEQHPADYVDTADGEHQWLEHRRFFTTNPSLYRRSLLKAGWPRGHHSEGVFTHRLLTSPKVRFGFWGARDDAPWVTHIGSDRAGVGY